MKGKNVLLYVDNAPFRVVLSRRRVAVFFKLRLIVDEETFQELGLPVPSQEKLPDIVLFEEKRNRLFLIEAVTSHGPVSPKRHLELEETFKACTVKRVYVSAFPDFNVFKNFITEIAWETEVWLSEIPDHLIHFNGDRHLATEVDACQ